MQLKQVDHDITLWHIKKRNRYIITIGVLKKSMRKHSSQIYCIFVVKNRSITACISRKTFKKELLDCLTKGEGPGQYPNDFGLEGCRTFCEGCHWFVKKEKNGTHTRTKKITTWCTVLRWKRILGGTKFFRIRCVQSQIFFEFWAENCRWNPVNIMQPDTDKKSFSLFVSAYGSIFSLLQKSQKNTDLLANIAVNTSWSELRSLQN